jgi:hypothetical protein
MIVAVKRLVVAAVAVALTAGCNSPGSDSSGPDSSGYRRPPLPPTPAEHPVDPPTTRVPTPPPTCPPEGVLLQSGETDGAAGLRALGITLLNCGHQTYRVDGYPVIQALDKDHRKVALKVLHGVTEIAGPIPDWNGPPNPITLEPGRQAECVVVWRNTYDDIRHPPVNAPYLEMAPAAGRPTQVLMPDAALDLGSTGRLGVGPWRLSKPTSRTTPAAPPPSTQPSVPSSIL